MVSESRAAVVKLLKARGAKARRGHLRIAVGDLFWYVDPRADGVGRNAYLVLEVGCWTPAAAPEPDGGAVDCPLLVDVPLEDLIADTTRLLDLITSIGDLATLGARLDELPGALVDQSLRDLLGA
ncbi:hypothetical protein BJ993_000152 [Nocardioides aromaticivorans]|uniref:Uncharacterized protein n=1 Tax=Nocardioides aromaticivorans TaxID=200618 RepID=A0A7Y9ZCT5_9ACTN|nr:hypothetical protein [Nocardioides aromaticivorans]NYI43072.1 hypothetical protein [Nocardioides aromaticivorans]QSR27030.1 hypothetical protein CFH99_15480 [Nocardioides aromaticivorans]